MLLVLSLFLWCSSGELIQLGYKNYTIAKKEYQPILVFYHGSDKSSKKFLPDYTAIANHEHKLQQNTNFPMNINFGLVDAVVEEKLMEKTQLGSTPQMFLFYGDTQKLKYSGPLNSQALINWIKKTVRDSPELNEFYPSSQIQKWGQFMNKLNSFQLIAILVTPEFRVAPLKAFVQAAKQLPQDYVFCHIFDPNIYQHLDVEKEQSQLIVYSKLEDLDGHDEDRDKKWKNHLYRFNGDARNSDEVLKFLKIYGFKKGFVYVDDSKFQKLTRRTDLLPTIMLLYNKTIPEHQKYVEEHKSHRYDLLNKALLGIIDVDGDCGERLDRWFGMNVNTTKLPKMIAIKPTNNDQFLKYRDGPKNAVEFYEQLNNGEIKPFYKDEGILSELYDGAGIYKLTRTTYFQYIKEQNEKGIDVVVMYTAKKCQPCRDFRPDFNDVYKRFKINMENKIVFTRLDIELNEIENLYIDNYPHIKLYAVGKDTPYTMHADKTEKGLLKWLKNSSNYPEVFEDKNNDL